MSGSARIIWVGYFVTIISFGLCLAMVFLFAAFGEAERAGWMLWSAVGMVGLNVAFKIAARIHSRSERRHG